MWTTLVLNLVAMFDAFMLFFKGFYQKLIEQVGLIFQHVYTWLEPLIPDAVKDIFEALANFWNDLDPLIDFITYFVPVWTILGIIMAAYFAAATIRTTRWLLALIPRVFTGL